MTLPQLSDQRVASLVKDDGILIDLRPIDDYLTEHISGAVSLLFEAGPGFGGRARDMLPISGKLILLADEMSDLDAAAAMLRGKGFYVAGAAAPQELRHVGTDRVDVDDATSLRLLDVADPGAVKQPSATFIPADRLWDEAASLDSSSGIGVLAGWGVRAATAVGILERRGFPRVVFVRTLPVGSRPPSAGPETNIFRVRG